MTGLDALRRIAMSLPEVTEGTHFRLPSFEVGEKSFLHLQKGATHAIVFVPRSEAEALAAAEPETFEVVWRNGSIFVGVRVDLDSAGTDRLADVIGHAWRHRAPKRLLRRYPEAGMSPA